MGVSSCFLTPLKILRLACTAATMTTGHFFFSLYCLPICNNILYCFLNHKQHCGRKKPLALLFISVWQMKMCGGGEPTGRENFFSLTLWCYYFKAHFTHFCFVLHFNSANEYLQDLQHVGENEIMFLKLCRRVQNLIYLRRMYYFSEYLNYWFKHLTHSHWTHFSSGNTSYFHLKDSESKYIL